VKDSKVQKMAQIVSVKMSKFDNQPWGFRLQGGIDFAAPLTVQKVSFSFSSLCYFSYLSRH
jgi:hypothetical protein